MTGSNLPNNTIGDMVRLNIVPEGVFDYLPDSEAQSLYSYCELPVRVERLDNNKTVTVLLSNVWNEEFDVWEGHELTGPSGPPPDRLNRRPLIFALATMTPLFRALTMLEAIICFAPVVYLWLLSLIAFPMMLLAFLSGAGIESLLGPAATIFGGIGLFGAGALFVSLDGSKVLVPWSKLRFCLVCGSVASFLGLLTLGLKEPVIWMIFTLPVVAYCHFLLLWKSRQ